MTRLLTDLRPRWFAHGGVVCGFTFDCPCCGNIRLPVDARRYVVTGDDFETVTVSPSIDWSASGHWHGFIRNGAIE